MKLEHLTLNILKDGKLSTEHLISHLSSAIDEDISCSEEYKELYEAAYGTVITKELAEAWVKSMAITDGSERENGLKWTMEQTTEYGNKVGIDWNKHTKTDFYIVMNMMYSDNYRTGKAINMAEEPMFYARLSRD